MGINRKLLPIKGHYFLNNAGTVPVFPFIPIIAKDLGFSSVGVGWTSTAAPILTIIIKPLMGTFADKYSCQKLMLLFLILFHALAIFTFQWSPAVPTSNSVELSCNDGINLTTCSGKLKEKCYSNRVLQSLNTTCKLQIEWRENISESLSHQNPNFGKKKLLPDTFSFHRTEIPVQLTNGTIEDDCVSIKAEILSTNESSFCEESGTISAELLCNDEVLRDLIKKPMLAESQEMFTSQYWTLFTFIILIRVSGSVLMSFGDTLCFNLLGDKPEDYGIQRMWGAIGWGSFSIIAGIIIDFMSSGKAEKDYTMSFYLSLAILTLNLIVITPIKESPKKKSKNIVKEVKQLFRNVKNIIFLAWCIICGVYVAFVWYYLFWFIEDLGAAGGCKANNGWIKTLEGLVLTIHCYAGEIPFFFMSGRILQKIGHKNAMTLVLFTFGVRFLLYSSLSDPWWILPIESLNGVTFGIFYATMTTYASTISPPGTEATIQNLVGAVFEGAGISTGSLLGGYLFKALGSSKTFFFIGLSAVLFGIFHVIFQNIFKNEDTVYYTGANTNSDEKNT